jgi:hypothetical protein
MKRGAFWLLAPVVVAAAAMFVFHGGEVERADRFFFQVMGVSLAIWILLGAYRALSNQRR